MNKKQKVAIFASAAIVVTLIISIVILAIATKKPVGLRIEFAGVSSNFSTGKNWTKYIWPHDRWVEQLVLGSLDQYCLQELEPRDKATNSGCDNDLSWYSSDILEVNGIQVCRGPYEDVHWLIPLKDSVHLSEALLDNVSDIIKSFFNPLYPNVNIIARKLNRYNNCVRPKVSGYLDLWFQGLLAATNRVLASYDVKEILSFVHPGHPDKLLSQNKGGIGSFYYKKKSLRAIELAVRKKFLKDIPSNFRNIFIELNAGSQLIKIKRKMPDIAIYYGFWENKPKEYQIYYIPYGFHTVLLINPSKIQDRRMRRCLYLKFRSIASNYLNSIVDNTVYGNPSDWLERLDFWAPNRWLSLGRFRPFENAIEEGLPTNRSTICENKQLRNISLKIGVLNLSDYPYILPLDPTRWDFLNFVKNSFDSVTVEIVNSLNDISNYDIILYKGTFDPLASNALALYLGRKPMSRNDIPELANSIFSLSNMDIYSIIDLYIKTPILSANSRELISLTRNITSQFYDNQFLFLLYSEPITVAIRQSKEKDNLNIHPIMNYRHGFIKLRRWIK